MTNAGTLVDAGTARQAEKLVHDSRFLLLGFKAPWCPQCGPQRGVVERVRDKFRDRMDFAYLDLAADESGAETFSVRTLPTLLLFRNGKEAARLTGFTPAPKLISSLDRLLGSD